MGIESGEDDDQRDGNVPLFPEPLLGAAAAASSVAQANTSENATMSRSPDLDNTLVQGGLRVTLQEVRLLGLVDFQKFRTVFLVISGK